MAIFLQRLLKLLIFSYICTGLTPSIMRKLFIAVLFLLVASATNLFSQTFLMPTSGYKEIHTQTGTLYDDGGLAAITLRGLMLGLRFIQLRLGLR